MSFEDCTNMIENGFDIGAHSKSHRWMEYLSADLIKNEIETDCQFINSLNIKPDFYCYPYGSGSRSKFIIDALTKAGFKYAFSIDPGKFNFLENDPYKIKRYDVNQFFFNVEI
jgi:peptidoglycan/xylan/chitin deacetylase (PgdA/CDA1 family)